MSKKNHSTKKHEKSKSKKDEKLESKKSENSKLKKDEKSEKSETNENHEFGKGKVDSFDKLVKENKASGKSWYNRLEGKWWWGMTEEKVRERLLEVEQILGKIKPDDINKENKPEIGSILESQMAQDIGQGLGIRAPELVKNISENLGKENISENLGKENIVDIKTDIKEYDPKINKDDKSETNTDIKEYDPKINKDDKSETNTDIDKK